MTVSTEWFDELEGDNQSIGSLDTYVDVDGSGIQFNADQISSSNFDGGIPKSTPSNTQVYNVVPGDYVFWNISTNSPITKGSVTSSNIDSETEDDLAFDTSNSLYLVVDIEYDDTNSNPDSTSATRYLYLQAEDDTKKVSASGSSYVTVIRESDVANWDGGTTGWMLTSSGNAIFGNVYARGAIYAQSGEISGDLDVSGDLNFTGSLVGNNPSGEIVGVAIYGNNPEIGTSNYTGVINAIGSNNQTAFDANDIQTFSKGTTTGALLRIQRLGGGLTIGNNNSNAANDIKMYGNLEIGSTAYSRTATIYGDLTVGTTTANKNATINGNLTVTGSITSGGGAVGPGSFTTLAATGAVTFSTNGTIQLGGSSATVNIGDPSVTSSDLNISGTARISATTGSALRLDTTANVFTLEVGGTVNASRLRVYNPQNSDDESFNVTSAGAVTAVNMTATTYSISNTGGSNANWAPVADNLRSLGYSGRRWSSVWAADNTINVSDERKKTEIVTSDLGLNFINLLNPVRYRWKVSHLIDDPESTEEEPKYIEVPGRRPRYGLISQEVKSVMDELGIDFGGWVLDDLEAENSFQSLRYTEFISPMIKAIQELSIELESVKERLAILEG